MAFARLIAIDALRGAAALAVVLHHAAAAAENAGTVSDLGWAGRSALAVLAYGGKGVVLFFVISGFCIHLTWARAVAGGVEPGISFLAFWRRRVFRLYPAYLAALGLYLMPQIWSGEFGWSAFDRYNLLTHLALVHNFDARTAAGIEGVFWTLAIEEQLYLAYFLLLALRDRFGWGPLLAMGLLARVCWLALTWPASIPNAISRPPLEAGMLAHWFVWMLGAVSVESAVGALRLPKWCGRPTLAVILIGAVLLVDRLEALSGTNGTLRQLIWLVRDPLWGLGAFVTINALVLREAEWTRSGRCPGWLQWFAKVGLFSYSLYLTHGLIQRYAGPMLLEAVGARRTLANMILFTPLCLAFAWLFFLVCERPFLNRARSNKVASRRAASLRALARRDGTRVTGLRGLGDSPSPRPHSA